MKTLQVIALTVMIIGALNWGLIGLFDFDLVAAIFGGMDALGSKIVYILVGICGLIGIKTLADLIADDHK
ncbi:MAG TPA: DUF378 domain-containing protein [Candidatus Aphodocola excrementigallinarum]|uniref:DUF378 domain-containing protein n=1 Tax=Candidatus Aphodocola excrementigallinarum TaxID=2840670 RepID=A0A9D1LHY7_9FIRM|nr:DUF378 domain-containing protein [Candidatus Aphodocola excrementigallinarum]